jgi:RNA polymerase sigma-70 factor (ECF subfamily)
VTLDVAKLAGGTQKRMRMTRSHPVAVMRLVTTAGDANQDRAGDDLDRLYRTLAPQLRGTARRSGADPDDFVQDSWLKLLGAAALGRIADPIRYLSGVARNLRVDRHRARGRSAAIFDGDMDATSVPDTLDPERALVAKQRLSAAVVTIQAMPPRCREAFLLYRFEGLQQAEIARRMGISVSMVAKHLGEAMIRLGRAMEEFDGPT